MAPTLGGPAGDPDAKAGSDLQFLWDDRRVPKELQKFILAQGYDDMSSFSLIAEDRAELKSIFTQEWGRETRICAAH